MTTFFPYVHVVTTFASPCLEQWSKKHLKAGCGYVEVECPNGCYDDYEEFDEDVYITIVMRKHHLRVECKQRPYQCEYCDKKDTFEYITESHYCECPEFPVPCPNNCGIMKLKQKMVNQHRKTCPLEIVVCPFVPEGCKDGIC